MLATVTVVAPIMMITSPTAAKRRQARADLQQPGEDQAHRAERLAHADEAQERGGEMGLRSQHLGRHHELHHAGEEEQRGQQALERSTGSSRSGNAADGRLRFSRGRSSSCLLRVSREFRIPGGPSVRPPCSTYTTNEGAPDRPIQAARAGQHAPGVFRGWDWPRGRCLDLPRGKLLRLTGPGASPYRPLGTVALRDFSSARAARSMRRGSWSRSVHSWNAGLGPRQRSSSTSSNKGASARSVARSLKRSASSRSAPSTPGGTTQSAMRGDEAGGILGSDPAHARKPSAESPTSAR